MSVKLAILQSKEQVIAEIKELVDDGNPVGYLFANPHCVYADKQYLAEENEDRSVQITLSPWILLTKDKVVTIPKEWVITIVNPIDSIVKMYQEKVDGQSN